MKRNFFYGRCLLHVLKRVAALTPSGRALMRLKGSLTKLCKSIVQELCESRGGRPGLSVLTSLLASVDVKLY